MRFIFVFLFSVLIIAQVAGKPDKIQLQSGELIFCIIKEISDSTVSFLIKTDSSVVLNYNQIFNVSIEGKGEIFNSTDGLIFYPVYINKFCSRRNITEFILTGDVNEHDYKPGDHELLIMPTAFTMNKKTVYLSDYELFFLNLTFAPTSRTHIGFFTFFPVVSSFLETFSLGIKQNYLRQPSFEAALWSSYTPKISTLSIGNVFSYKAGKHSFHLGLGSFVNLEDKSKSTEFMYMGGANLELSRNICLLAEYTNLSSLADKNFNGLISVGFRFRSEKTAWEIGGIRPLEKVEGLILFPILKATLTF